MKGRQDQNKENGSEYGAEAGAPGGGGTQEPRGRREAEKGGRKRGGYAEEIRERIKTLAACYTPEWRFSEREPDAGAVIAMIFAELMEAVLFERERLWEMCGRALADLAGVDALPPKPARMQLLLTAAPNQGRGFFMKKGTRFWAEAHDGGMPVPFETERGIFVTAAKVQRVLSADPKKKEIAERKLPGGEKEALPGERLLLFHRLFGQVGTEALFFRFEGDPAFSSALIAGETYRSYWQKGEQRRRIFWQEQPEGWLCPRAGEPGTGADREPLANDEDEEKGTALVIESGKENGGAVYLSEIKIKPAQTEGAPDFVCTGEQEQNGREIRLFGQELNVCQESFIGIRRLFAIPGTEITVSFELRTEKREYLTEAREENFPLIRRAPRAAVPFCPETLVQEAAWTYFNGKGYRSLPVCAEASRLFDTKEKRSCRITFRCPDDWEPQQVGGFEGRAVRIQIVRADGCYHRPCIQYLPVLDSIRISAVCPGGGFAPEEAVSVQGARVRRFEGLKAGAGKENELCGAEMREEVFCGFPYQEPCTLVEIDRAFGGGPVSLFLTLAEQTGREPVRPLFYYGAGREFLPLRAVDGTQGLTRSGAIEFLPPADMAVTEVEGCRGWWLKIVPELPGLKDICLNGTSAVNIRRGSPEPFFLERARTELEIPLGEEQLLYADVWVNEKGRLSEAQMARLKRLWPEEVREERSLDGRTEEFFVRWRERGADGASQEAALRGEGPAENGRRADLETQEYPAGRRRVYTVDWQKRRLKFGGGPGDGIPAETARTAFLVRRVSCDGERGNVEAHTVRLTAGAPAGLAAADNPRGAFGGRDAEREEAAAKRAAHVLAHRNRLLTAKDWELAIRDLSEDIREAACFLSWGAGGETEITVAVLMREQGEGAQPFAKLQEAIGGFLEKRCLCTCPRDRIRVREPVYLRVAAQIWLGREEQGRLLELREELLAALDRLFEESGQKIGFSPAPAFERLLKPFWRRGVLRCAGLLFFREGETRPVRLETLSEESLRMAVFRPGEHQIYL